MSSQLFAKTRVFSLSSLMQETFNPIKWGVDGIFPQGCILFAGRPKLGKSWFMLQLALDLASGGKALGHIPVKQCDVLYLALEDTRRRLQSRVKRLLGDKAFPEGLSFSTNWANLDNGGAEELEDYLEHHPETRMVIIDTFRKIKSRKNGDFESLSRLGEIAQRYDLCLLIVHHTRKADAADAFDTVSGSTETSSLADAMLVLKRTRCSSYAELFITGRDIEEAKKALRFDKEKLSWELLGDADEVWKSEQRREIIDLLKEKGRSMTPAEIADEMEKSRTAVRKTLSRMVNDNQIDWDEGGRYRLKSKDDPRKAEQTRKSREANRAIRKVYGDPNWDAEGDLPGDYDFIDVIDELDEAIRRIYGGQETEQETEYDQNEVQTATENPADDKTEGAAEWCLSDEVEWTPEELALLKKPAATTATEAAVPKQETIAATLKAARPRYQRPIAESKVSISFGHWPLRRFPWE